MTCPVIDIQHLDFRYEDRNRVLHDVNLQVNSGEFDCIVGPNGGGKSTLLHLILGFLAPESGTIRLFGEPPRVGRARVGFMPQYHQLDPDFPITVFEVVLMGRLRRGFWGRYSAEDRAYARQALDELGVGSLADRTFAGLSGGQRQRVLIARALASQPELLLLDEPTANVDPGAEQEFFGTLYELRKRMTIITVSHDLGFINREVDNVICVNGTVSLHHVADFNASAANAVYHHPVEAIRHNHDCGCAAVEEEEEARR